MEDEKRINMLELENFFLKIDLARVRSEKAKELINGQIIANKITLERLEFKLWRLSHQKNTNESTEV